MRDNFNEFKSSKPELSKSIIQFFAKLDEELLKNIEPNNQEVNIDKNILLKGINNARKKLFSPLAY